MSIEHTQINRRGFIALAVGSALALAKNPHLIDAGEITSKAEPDCRAAAMVTSRGAEKPDYITMHYTDWKSSKACLQLPDDKLFGLFLEQLDIEQLQTSPLALVEEKARISSLIPLQELFSDMHALSGVTIEAQNEDFEMYFEMYVAAQHRFSVPWQLLWVIHEQETRASRFAWPWASGFRGAMQIAPSHLRHEHIAEAGLGYEYLDTLPQRYHPQNGFDTKDWEEILRSAAFIRWQSEIRYADEQGNVGEEQFLQTVKRNYSALIYGIERVKKYQQLKSLFYEN